jgi:hypothetical protein
MTEVKGRGFETDVDSVCRFTARVNPGEVNKGTGMEESDRGGGRGKGEVEELE